MGSQKMVQRMVAVSLSGSDGMQKAVKRHQSTAVMAVSAVAEVGSHTNLTSHADLRPRFNEILKTWLG